MNPPSTPAPINDIAGPVAIPGYPVEWMIGGAVALIVLALFLLWFLNRRGRKPVLTPRQKALAALAALAELQGDSYDFGVRASDILRNYIREAHGLDAVNQTSLEFLNSLRDHHVFNDNEKSSLAAFLEASDLLKFARKEADGGELHLLLETARRLVNAEGEEVIKA